MYQYAAFKCSSCEYEFAHHLPPLHEDLPFCPLCGSSSMLNILLCDRVIAFAPVEAPYRL